MKTVFIDMDDVLCDFTSAFKQAIALNPSIKYPQSQYGFFTNLEPIPGGLNAVAAFLKSPEIEPYILTAPSVRNPLCYTEKRVWVENHLGIEMVNRLIISPDKSLLMGDYLIDDMAEGRGQDRFTGTLMQFGSGDFPDWESVRTYFEI